ncbi:MULTISPECIES: YwqG family protein [unclassified Leptotrichia]|jgi:hypothetical protein|uniref:YwqG family protein n=1 Tax=unclassified Leptotrichia TaxID=2633022 RepID=UPI0003ADBEAC|nr:MULTISPECIES: YwqG family protein [unclassified Leptotrichia]ERL03326.1 hypothetical protein HMPREF9108_02379 [Leptotrichia sp. oral taxon 225 str. F0581]WLD74413.1 YwqG family protein [Leptotrichia sp. HMT-225]
MENELEIKIDDEFAKKVYDEIWVEYEKTAQTKTFAKITLTENELKITDSKVMGLPYIPKGAQIPQTANGDKMMMIAQINCDDLQGLADFPEKGILQFFVLNDEDGLLGLDFDNQTVQDSFRVIYHEKIEEFYDENELKSIYNPYNFEESYITNDNESYKMNFELTSEKERFEDMFYHIFRKICKEKGLKQTQEDWLYRKLLNFMQYSENYYSQCDGFAFFTQDDPREYNEEYKKFDTVLFQLNSEFDENTRNWKVCIGDAGVINFFINRENLKKKDFSEILYNWDCS